MSHRISLTDWLINSAKSGSKISLFEDVIFSAIHISTLCDLILKIIDERILGTFNVGAKDSLSKADFARLFATECNLDLKYAQLRSIDDMSFLAKRPKNMSLNVGLVEKALDFSMPYIEEEVLKAVNDYQTKSRH